jgi:hypothetical protein
LIGSDNVNKMFLNVIHRVDSEEKDIEALKFQLEEAHRLGLKATNLLTYPALHNSEVIEYIKEQHRIYGDELGIHFHAMVCKDFIERFNSKEPAIYFYTMEEKKAIITYIFEKFNEVFGFYPSAVGSYILDAETISFIKQRYPGVKTSIINCFEEGVKMYEGNNHSWYLFSDGGPWSAYYPSKDNHLCPAVNKEDSLRIVGLPHLNRDMLMALTSRDDYFASHPINLIRAKINIGGESPYMYRFIDKWIEQAQYNGYSYYSFFVSSPWVAPGQGFVESVEDARELYCKSLRYLKKKVEEGTVETVTMSEFADWYERNIGLAKPEVNLWSDILCGSKREMYWYIDPYLRAAIDPNIGGAICDLRPYVGRVEGNLGPDTKNLWNGNYPFILSTENRGGVDGPIHTCVITCNGNSKMLHNYRSICRLIVNEEGHNGVVIEPITVDFDDVQVTIETTYVFKEEGDIYIERKILEVSSANAVVQLEELHRGTWGTTEYPENMKGIQLTVRGKDNTMHQTNYQYKCHSAEVSSPEYLEAVIPQINCRVSLRPIGEVECGRFEEGYMFAPFYTLSLRKLVSKGGTLKSCLKIKKL